MSRDLGGTLPPLLLRRFSGDDIAAHADKALLIVSLDDEGGPHPAVLSHFEVVARDPGTLRLATYSDSRTTSNLRQRGAATLIVIDDGFSYYIKGSVREIRRTMEGSPHNALMELRVERVLSDRADVEREGEAVITGGVTYHDPNREARLAGAAAFYEEMLSGG